MNAIYITTWIANLLFLFLALAIIVGLLFIARALVAGFKLLGRLHPDGPKEINHGAFKRWRRTQQGAIALFSAGLLMMFIDCLGSLPRFLAVILNDYDLEVLYRKLFFDQGRLVASVMFLLVIAGIVLEIIGKRMAEKMGMDWPTIFEKEWWVGKSSN